MRGVSRQGTTWQADTEPLKSLYYKVRPRTHRGGRRQGGHVEATNAGSRAPRGKRRFAHKVSVVVPTYNVERYLDQCLTSIQMQPFANVEVICVNDGSTDGSLGIMQEHAARDPRVRVIDKPNAGYGAACNAGFDSATGDYVAIVEPDDYLTGNMFGDLLDFADSLDGGPVDIVKSSYWRIFNAGTPHELRTVCLYQDRVNPPRQPFAIGDGVALLEHHPSIWTALYRKAFLDGRGIRFREYPGAAWADNPFLVETLCQTDRIAYVNRPYYNYREDTEEKLVSSTRRDPLLPIERWNDMQDIVERLGVTDERVLSAQAKRAISYCGLTIDAVGLGYPGVREAIAQTYQRLDYGLVMGQPLVTPAAKRLFCEFTGRPDPQVGRLSMLPAAAGEVWYRLRHTSPSYTWFSIASFMRHRRGRIGSKG